MWLFNIKKYKQSILLLIIVCVILTPQNQTMAQERGARGSISSGIEKISNVGSILIKSFISSSKKIKNGVSNLSYVVLGFLTPWGDKKSNLALYRGEPEEDKVEKQKGFIPNNYLRNNYFLSREDFDNSINNYNPETEIKFTKEELKKGADFKIESMEIDLLEEKEEKIKNNNSKKIKSFILKNLGEGEVVGGQHGWKIKNQGNMSSALFIYTDDIRNYENGCNDQERDAEPRCKKDNLGELGELVELYFSIDGEDLTSITLAEGNERRVGQSLSKKPSFILKPGQEISVIARWDLDENSYGNEIQSDSVHFDLIFRLIQLTDEGRVFN